MLTRTAHTAVTPPPTYSNRLHLLYAPNCLYLLDCIYKHHWQHKMKDNLVQLTHSPYLCVWVYSVMTYLCFINICWIPTYILVKGFSNTNVFTSYWYNMIYLTAVGFTPCGSSTVYIYTQKIHRTTESTQTIHRTIQFPD